LNIHISIKLGAKEIIISKPIKHNNVEKKGSFFFDTPRGKKQVFCKTMFFDKNDRKQLIIKHFKKNVLFFS